MKKGLIFIFVVAAIILLFEHCAKMPGTISGGPKDMAPPQFLYSTPSNYSTNLDVNTKRIEMTFDEFLQLKDANSQFYSSPPIKKKPEILLYNKTVRVNLKEPLLPGMTYSFNFGESIVDNNEGNKMTGFLYVFSTGAQIDTLMLTGRVLNAFDLTPQKKDDKVPTAVMLYDDLSDSAVYKHPPTYMTRTDHLGFFTIPYIRPDTFRVFAIRDMGDNLIFDMPTEQVAFLDTVMVLDQRYYHDPEIPIFTSLNLPDTIKEKNPDLIHKDIMLYRFQEAPTKQYRIAYERSEANRLRFVYSLPVDSLPVKIAEYEPAGKWFQLEASANNDTLDFWLLDTTLVNRKILMVQISSPRTDSLNHLVYAPDTLKMSFEPPKKVADKRSRKERKEDEENGKNIRPRTAVETMTIMSNIKAGGTMELTDRLQLIASQPIDRIDPSKIILMEEVDTLKKPVRFTLVEDSANMRKCYLDWKLNEGIKYFLTIDTMSFSSIYQVYNDSTGFNFTAQKMDYYSSIEITFNNVKCSLIVQVLKPGDKESIVKQMILPEGNVVHLDFLKPDKYKIKVIYDKNGNGKWDTGHYLEKIQPEKVDYYNTEVETKSSFKTELHWALP